MVHLALPLWVSIETWRQSITGEGGLGNLGEVRIVSARGSRDGADLLLLVAGGAHKEESQKSCIRNIKYKYSDMKCRNAIKAARLSVMKHFNKQRRGEGGEHQKPGIYKMWQMVADILSSFSKPL